MKTMTKSPEEQLTALLETRTLDQLVAAGEVFTAEGAARRLGYAPWSIRRLCRRGRLGHIRLGAKGEYLFLKSQLSDAFTFIARARP